MPLPFLPPELTGFPSDDELFDAAYSVFRNDFVVSRPSLNQLEVQIATKISVEGWEESFVHIISRDAAQGAPRAKNPARAKRVPWVKPFIENCSDPALTYFMYLEGTGYVRHYIWNQADDYVVILESKNGALRLVTAFVIDVPWKRYDLQKKLAKAKK